MKRAIAILVALVFLASGLIRIGVSGLMIGEAAGWWSFGGEAAEALAGTRAFLAEAPMNLLGFSVPAYFAYIGAMGLVVSVGAVGALLRRRWGLTWLAAYTAMHGALFVNFWTINPKIWLVALSAAAIGVLWWANGEGRA
ncbi:hypothetical protein [Qipengyuania sp.]|uniref:hypothetical protein n=1 Tax=Qipengyuania sp. TaxID=2004515 RepID=UPI003BA9676A